MDANLIWLESMTLDRGVKNLSAARQISVTIDDELVDVRVVKTGAVTWRAYADFRGRHVAATGSSQSNAVDNWRKMADYLSKD